MEEKPTYNALKSRIEELENEIERVREEGEKKYKALAIAGRIGRSDWDLVTEKVYFDPNLFTLLGYDETETVESIDDLVGLLRPDDIDNVRRDIEGVRTSIRPESAESESEYEVEYRLRHRDGNFRWFLARGTATRDNKGKIKKLSGTLEYITQRKRVEDALGHKIIELNSFINNIPDMAWIKDTQSRFIVANKAFGDTVGMAPELLINQTCEVCFGKEEGAKFKKDDQEVMRGGKRVVIEEKIVDANNKEVWLETIKSPIWDEFGEIIGSVGISRDISERRRVREALELANAELKNTQAQLIHSGKLASIGELAAGVAHELNQPLTVARNNAQLIKCGLHEGTIGPERLIEQVELMERNTKRMMNIINHLQTFSRQATSEYTPIDVNSVIEDSFMMIGEQLRSRNIIVEKKLSSRLPKILGNATQIEQVILNLITNARDAIEAKGDEKPGVITISTHKKKNTGVITVKDTGRGIPGHNVYKVFDPFFTTKEVGKGTGLGLSISYGITEDHRGKIELAETSPAGTTFILTLPLYEGAALN